MFVRETGGEPRENYTAMTKAVGELLATETDVTANLSVITSMINAYMPDLNWVGFYLMKDGELVVGPFQGEPPCLRIKVGRGVCGTAAATGKTQVVPDVHQFKGHIACDSKSRSEIVIPVLRGETLYGVLDADSPLLARFTPLEEEYLTEIAEMLGRFLEGSPPG